MCSFGLAGAAAVAAASADAITTAARWLLAEGSADAVGVVAAGQVEGIESAET